MLDASGALFHLPRRKPKLTNVVEHPAHPLQAIEGGRSMLTEIVVKQLLALRVAVGVINTHRRKIEIGIADARVFPVDEPETPIVDDVEVMHVVVTKAARRVAMQGVDELECMCS